MINANGLDHLSEDEVSLAAVEKITTFLWPAHLGKNDVKICKICTYTYLYIYIYIYIHVCVLLSCVKLLQIKSLWRNGITIKTVPKKSVEHKQRHKQKKNSPHWTLQGTNPPQQKKKKRVPGNQPSPFRWLKKTRRVETPFWTTPRLATTRWLFSPMAWTEHFFRCFLIRPASLETANLSTLKG